MRLGLYVYVPGNVTFSSEGQLTQYNGSQQTLSGKIWLPAGVYGFTPFKTNTSVSTETKCEVVIADDKGPWPDPETNPLFRSTFPEITTFEVEKLFPGIAKSYQSSLPSSKSEPNGHGGAEGKNLGPTSG